MGMMARGCGWVRPRIFKLVDGSLGPDELSESRSHLRVCPACRAEEEALRRLRKDLFRAERPALDASFTDAVMARVRGTSPTIHARRGPGIRIPSLAAAAAVLLVIGFFAARHLKAP